MEHENLLDAVQNDRIEFITMRPPGSPFATLERRVVITGPPELVAIAESGEAAWLDELVEHLEEPERAWAAAVLLAAMTGREAKLVDAFAARPDEWWGAVGETAHERWAAWLAGARDHLVWDAETGMFVEAAEPQE
ncbi:MAG: hypothetical protein R2844_23120 [Caldilineales bacterium]